MGIATCKGLNNASLMDNLYIYKGIKLKKQFQKILKLNIDVNEAKK